MENYENGKFQKLNYIVDPAKGEENDFGIGKVIISIGSRRLEGYKDILGDDYVNPYAGQEMNSDFAGLELNDDRFGLLGAVPLIIVVDKDKWVYREEPRSFGDLSKETYRNGIIYTVDEALLEQTVYPNFLDLYGEEKLESFKANLVEGMHPSEMLNRGNYKGDAFVYIMPYIFAIMKLSMDKASLIWPEDVAFCHPFFISCQKSLFEEGAKAEDLLIQEFLEEIRREELAGILSAAGKFPSSAPVQENKLPGKIRIRPDILERAEF